MGVIDKNIGFIGTGGIATALARGFCMSEDFTGKVYVYDIKGERVSALKELFPGKIAALASNQDVVDEACVVFPALLPKVLEEVAPTLKFREENHVIHIAAATKLSKALPWYAGAGSVVRAIPLPFASRRVGPVVLYGDDETSEAVLSLLGTVVRVQIEKHLDILSSVTALMVPYFGLVGEVAKWCESKGMNHESGLDYVCLMNEALSNLMMKECGGDVSEFMQKNITPGGLNEAALRTLTDAGAYTPWIDALEKVYSRYDD
jgi:pyrroline-5-carboxylate reductase